MVARRSRRTPAKKAAAPVETTPVEPEVVAEVVAEEPVTEEVKDELNTTTEADITADTVDEINEEEEEEEDEDPKKELTIEEKIEQLDQLSKAHPFGLISNLCKLSNHYKSYYEIEKKTEGEGDKKEKYMQVIARYGATKITIPKIPGDNFRFAKKIGADLLLHHLYADDHEIDDKTKELKESTEITTETDEEWYKEKKEVHEKYCNARVDKIVKKIRDNDRYSDEDKKTKIEKFETWRKCAENLLEYDEVYKMFDNPYYRVMHNAISYPKNRNLSYVCTVQKAEDPTVKTIEEVNWIDIPITAKGEKRSEATKAFYEELSKNKDEGAATPKIRITIKVSNNDQVILELQHAAENNNLKEIKSDAAYKVLEQLLRDGTIPKVTRKDLRNQNENARNGRFNKNGKNGQNMRGKNMRGRGRGGARNNTRAPNPNQNKAKGQGGKTGTVGKNTNKTPVKKNQVKKENNTAKPMGNNKVAKPMGNQNNRRPQQNNQARKAPMQNNMMMGGMMQQPMMQGGYMMGGGHNGQQQMMMMPVMMNAQGQYMIPQSAMMGGHNGQQPMMMMQQPQMSYNQNTARPMHNNQSARPQAIQPRHMANNNQNNRGGMKRGGRGNFRGGRGAKRVKRN